MVFTTGPSAASFFTSHRDPFRCVFSRPPETRQSLSQQSNFWNPVTHITSCRVVKNDDGPCLRFSCRAHFLFVFQADTLRQRKSQSSRTARARARC